jgi:hypothetical protein
MFALGDDWGHVVSLATMQGLDHPTHRLDAHTFHMRHTRRSEKSHR